MTDDQHTLEIERTFKAPPEKVFEAFTSEEVMRRWWHAGPDWETPEATVELQVGGKVRVVMRNPHIDTEYGGSGVYSEIDPPRRLAFTWIWDEETRGTLIEIDFRDTGDGATHVRFKHSKLWTEKAVEEHRSGWTRCFNNVNGALGAG
jgi:uncharacterized protein YndB with AHSA1/START domain